MASKYWAVPISSEWTEVRCGKKPVLIKKQIVLPDRRRVTISCWQGGRKSGVMKRKFLTTIGAQEVSCNQVKFWRKEGILT